MGNTKTSGGKSGGGAMSGGAKVSASIVVDEAKSKPFNDEVEHFGPENINQAHEFFLKEPRTVGSADHYGKDNSMLGKWANNTTNEEKDAMKEYTGSFYSSFNKNLRKGVDGNDLSHLTPTQREVMKDMDSAISKFQLNKSITVTRGSGAELLGKDVHSASDVHKLVGSIVTDQGYVSASTGKNPAFSDDFIYHIQIPKGKGRGVYVDSFSKHKGENEFVIKRNAKFVVLGAYEKGSGWDKEVHVNLQMVTVK